MEIVFGGKTETLESVIERHARAYELKLTQEQGDFAKSMFNVGRENPFDHKDKCDCPVCLSERAMGKKIEATK